MKWDCFVENSLPKFTFFNSTLKLAYMKKNGNLNDDISVSNALPYLLINVNGSMLESSSTPTDTDIMVSNGKKRTSSIQEYFDKQKIYFFNGIGWKSNVGVIFIKRVTAAHVFPFTGQSIPHQGNEPQISPNTCVWKSLWITACTKW